LGAIGSTGSRRNSPDWTGLVDRVGSPTEKVGPAGFTIVRVTDWTLKRCAHHGQVPGSGV